MKKIARFPSATSRSSHVGREKRCLDYLLRFTTITTLLITGRVLAQEWDIWGVPNQTWEYVDFHGTQDQLPVAVAGVYRSYEMPGDSSTLLLWTASASAFLGDDGAAQVNAHISQRAGGVTGICAENRLFPLVVDVPGHTTEPVQIELSFDAYEYIHTTGGNLLSGSGHCKLQVWFNSTLVLEFLFNVIDDYYYGYTWEKIVTTSNNPLWTMPGITNFLSYHLSCTARGGSFREPFSQMYDDSTSVTLSRPYVSRCRLANGDDVAYTATGLKGCILSDPQTATSIPGVNLETTGVVTNGSDLTLSLRAENTTTQNVNSVRLYDWCADGEPSWLSTPSGWIGSWVADPDKPGFWHGRCEILGALGMQSPACCTLTSTSVLEFVIFVPGPSTGRLALDERTGDTIFENGERSGLDAYVGPAAVIDSQRPQISSLTLLSHTNITLTLRNLVSSVPYTVERRASLVTGQWDTVGSFVPIDSQTLWSEAVNNTWPTMFYRIRMTE